jgi:transposase
MTGEFEKNYAEEPQEDREGGLEPEREPQGAGGAELGALGSGAPPAQDRTQDSPSRAEADRSESAGAGSDGVETAGVEGTAPESARAGWAPGERVLRLTPRRKGRRLVRKPDLVRGPLSAEQRLLLLDTWRRSGLPAGDFASLVGVSRHTLYAWKKRFETRGPAGLVDEPRGGPRGSRLSDVTRRAILMLKEANPEWGCQRISDMLLRGPALPASPSAVARVLHEGGYELEEVSTRPHGHEN